jgi:hypothetical protein
MASATATITIIRVLTFIAVLLFFPPNIDRASFEDGAEGTLKAASIHGSEQ